MTDKERGAESQFLQQGRDKGPLRLHGIVKGQHHQFVRDRHRTRRQRCRAEAACHTERQTANRRAGESALLKELPSRDGSLSKHGNSNSHFSPSSRVLHCGYSTLTDRDSTVGDDVHRPQQT